MATKFNKQNTVEPKLKTQPAKIDEKTVEKVAQEAEENGVEIAELSTLTVEMQETATEPKFKEKKSASEKKASDEKKKPLGDLQVDGPGKNYSIYLENALVEEIEELGAQQGIKNRSKIIKYLLKKALSELEDK